MAAQVHLNIIEGQRPHSRIFTAGGYYYHLNRIRPNHNFAYLRCVNHRARNQYCLGKAAFPVGGGVLRLTCVHNHAPDLYFPQVLALRRAIISRVRDGDPAPFSVIVREEGLRGRFPAVVRSRVSAVRMRSTLRKARLANYPPIPRHLGVLGGLLSLQEYSFISRSMDEEDNLYAGMCGKVAEGTFSVLFISRRMRAFMSRVKKAFSDGTFKAKCQEPQCIQIFSIVTSWRYHVIPLVRVLMQRRTTQSYVVLFEFLRDLVPDFYPQFVMSDHEKAQVKGWLAVFPQARICQCLWHFDVAVLRYAGELGLIALLRENMDASSIVRSMCAIPLVPNRLIRPAFLQLVVEAETLGLYRELLPLFEYFQREWLPRAGKLSVCGSSDRTNNCCESANKSLNLAVGEENPNVWNLIRGFAKSEDQAYIDILTLTMGEEASRLRKASALCNDARVNALTLDLCRGDISILEFLHRASRTMNTVFDEAVN